MMGGVAEDMHWRVQLDSQLRGSQKDLSDIPKQVNLGPPTLR